MNEEQEIEEEREGFLGGGSPPHCSRRGRGGPLLAFDVEAREA
jgi:hypothetical protein